MPNKSEIKIKKSSENSSTKNQTSIFMQNNLNMYFLLSLYDHDDLLGFPNPINLSNKTSWNVKLVKPF